MSSLTFRDEDLEHWAQVIESNSTAVWQWIFLGGSNFKMNIDQLGCVGMTRGGKLNGEAPTIELPNKWMEGIEEEDIVEGRQGGWFPAFNKLPWEIRDSSSEALEANPKPGGRVTRRHFCLMSELSSDQIHERHFLRGAFSSFPWLEVCKERLVTVCQEFGKGHSYSKCEAGLGELSAPFQLCDPLADVGSLPSNCKYLCIPKL